MKKTRVFYGWYIMLAGMAITVIHGALYVYGFGAFFIHFQNAFNASRAQIGLVLGLSRLEGGLVAPVSGFIIDRFGPRRPMIFGLILVGVGFILLSRVDTLIMFYFIYVGLLATGSSFGSARPIQISLANWFIKKRSRAMGFLMTGFGIGGSLVFVYSWVIEALGWRSACVLSGVLILVVSIPLSLVIKHRPEDMGLLPDGEDPENWKDTPASGEGESVDKSNSVLNETNLTARQAMGTKAFWILALVFATWSLVPPTITAHMIPYLQQEIGATPAIAALSLSGFAFISLFGRIPIGWLGDYVNLRYLLAILFVFMGLGLLVLAQIKTTAYIPLALIIMGPAYGGSVPVRPALQGYLFGRMAFGTIGGLLQFFDLPAAIAAPVFVGWIADEYSYRLGFRIVACLIIIGSLAVLAAKPPKDIYR